MHAIDLQKLILDRFDGLPPKLQAGAKYLLDHPDDAALLSMRDLAKAAAVSPATMSRLAKRLGFADFDRLRQIYERTVRERSVVIGDRFTDRAEGLVTRLSLDGDSALVADTLAGLSGHLRALSEPETIRVLREAADIIERSARVFFVGARSSYPAMFLGSYLMAMIGDHTVLVDGAGGTGLDQLRDVGRRDAMLALSIQPYTRNTVEAVGFAVERRANIIAITDSLASPIARPAHKTIIVPTETPSFLQTMTPAFVVIECLAALVAARRGKRAVRAIREAEAHLDHFGSYVADT